MPTHEPTPAQLSKMSNDELKSKGYIRIAGFTKADGTKVKAHIRKLDPSGSKDTSAKKDKGFFNDLFSSVEEFKKETEAAVAAVQKSTKEALDIVKAELKDLPGDVMKKIEQAEKSLDETIEEWKGVEESKEFMNVYYEQSGAVRNDDYGSGLHSMGRHQSAASFVSDKIAKPFHEAGVGLIGDIIGDTVAFSLGAIREIPSVNRSLAAAANFEWEVAKKGLQAVADDIVDNYKGSFGAEYDKGMKKIYKEIFTLTEKSPLELEKLNKKELASFGYLKVPKGAKLSAKSLKAKGFIRVPAYTKADGTKVDGYIKKVFK